MPLLKCHVHFRDKEMAIETKMKYKNLQGLVYCYWQNSWSNNHVWEIVCLFVTDRKLQAVKIFCFVFIVDLHLLARIALLWFRVCSSVQAPPLLASNSLRKESRNLKNCSFNLNNNKHGSHNVFIFLSETWKSFRTDAHRLGFKYRCSIHKLFAA